MTATTLSIEVGNVAQWVWRTSLEATLLIAVVFLIGWAAGRRLPPRWRYVLGLLILARLVLPITLPGTWGFNMLVPDDISEPRWTRGYDTFEQSRNDIQAPVIVESPSVPEQVPADAPSSRAASWSLSGFWAAGVFLVFGATVVRMILFTIRIRGAVPVVRTDSLELLDDCRANLGVTRAVTMFELQGLGTPALYVMFHPKLLLPHGFLERFSPREIRLVFLHELAHLKAHDILLNWLIAMASAIHWFNPVTWLALRRLRQDREILRDSQVLHRLAPQERATYGQTLLKLSETLSGGVPCPSFIPVVNHRSQITRRIIMITRYRKESRASNIGLAAVVAVLALVTFSTPGSELADESTLGAATSYPWSENSEYVQVGKDLLERISIRSVTITNGNTVQFVLAPEFVHACLLTSEEIERMNAALTNALHEYRTVQLGRWNDASEYVDLPKPVVMALKVPGLTDDETLSPEAIALLGLATNEVHAVNEIYQQMKLRTEAVERGNLVKPDPEKTRFILRAFPEQAALLKREWLTNLTERIGAGRAELLDQVIRTSLWPPVRRDHKAFDWDLRTWAGPRWFDRGLFDLRIEVENVKLPNALDGLQIRYESDSPESGDLGGPDIPARFRHLLTPDMLDGPGPL